MIDMAIPDGVQIDRGRRIAMWRPRGVLTVAVVRAVHAVVEAEEAAATEPFQRFTDLSAIEGIQMGFPEVEEIANGRIESYQGSRVKSAIFAPTPLAFGIARMYEQLMRRSPIEVGVFSELGSAAAWLDVPVRLLTIDS